MQTVAGWARRLPVGGPSGRDGRARDPVLGELRRLAEAWRGRPLPAPPPPGASLELKVAVLQEAVATLKEDYKRIEVKLNLVLAAVVLSPFTALLVQRFLLR